MIGDRIQNTKYLLFIIRRRAREHPTDTHTPQQANKQKLFVLSVHISHVMDQAANNSQRFSAEEGAGPSSIQDSESQDDKNNKLNDTGDVSIIDVVPSSETGGSVNCSSARETASTAVEDDSTTKLPTLMDNENPGPQHGALVQHGLVVHHHDDDVVGGGEVDDIKNDVGFYRETKPACADKTSSAGSPAAGSLSSAVQAVNSKAASSRDVAREMHNQQQHVVAADKVKPFWRFSFRFIFLVMGAFASLKAAHIAAASSAACPPRCANHGMDV